MYIESTDRFTGFRTQANTFFLSINTALVGFIATVLEFSTKHPTSFWIIFACIAGLILCTSWWLLVRSYRTLNSGRFQVIHELEKNLPIQIYAKEWEILTNLKPRHIPQTHLEQIVPITFGILYVGIALTLIFVR